MASTTATVRVLSRRAQLQLLWLRIHRWIGLGLLPVFAAFALSGALLVWPEHVDRIVNPSRYPADASRPPVAASVLLQAGQQALPPGDHVSGIRYSEGVSAIRIAGQASGPAALGVGPPNRAMMWLDPADAKVLATGESSGSFLWFLRALHGHLLVEHGGRELVAIAGLVLLASAGTGLWLWWPGLRNIGRALRWRPHASLSMNLHRQGGVLIVLILLLEAFTGVYAAVPGFFSALISPVSGTADHSEGTPVSHTLPNVQQNIDAVLASAQALVPGGRPVTILLPTQGNPQWTVNIATGEEERTVHVADATGAASVQALAAPTAAERVEQVILDLHFGDYGPAWKVVVFICGIVLTLLTTTGPLLWLQGRARRARRTQAG